MIKKVVPLSEKHSAIHMLTLQDFDEALGIRVLILVDLELTSTWNGFVNFEWLCIEPLARDDLHFVHCFRDLCPNFSITDLITSYYFGNTIMALINRADRLFSFGLILSKRSRSFRFFIFPLWWRGGVAQLNYSFGLEIVWRRSYTLLTVVICDNLFIIIRFRVLLFVYFQWFKSWI